MKDLLLAFYGDDFTGSTDALEAASRAGLKTVLFMAPPTEEQLSEYGDLDAIGVAGKTRALAPAEMEAELLPAFQQMKALAPRHVHYKVCSTFDSSPTVGSIGVAIDSGASVFQNKRVAVVGGTPALGRYCVFGNLFARMGIGSNGAIHRLDRHPSMRCHPVTPATESDLRKHLEMQTNKPIGLIDIVTMEKAFPEWEASLQGDEEVVLLDALTECNMQAIGDWLDAQVREGRPLFSVGSSAVEAALGFHWNSNNQFHTMNDWPAIQPVKNILVISGSCSPVTAAQISFAKGEGFVELIWRAGNAAALEEEVVHALHSQASVIVHTGEKASQALSSQVVGEGLGQLAKAAVQRTGVRRVVIAGGDTSSYAARAMEIDAVEMIASYVSGAPLCRVHSANEAMHGSEINVKGGQVGGEDYFVRLRRPHPHSLFS